MLFRSQGTECVIEVSIQIDNESYSKPIRYINGEVSFNSYQGNYMPEIQDTFFKSDLEELTDELVGFLKTHFENMREKVDSDIYSIIKDGDKSPVADIPCWECDEEYICVNEDYGVFGQCLNCGEMNDISICYRCSCYFEGVSSDDEPVFCENCLDYFEKE